MVGVDYSYGVWLLDDARWAELPDRMCKPTLYNTDLQPANRYMEWLKGNGVECEVRKIPSRKLKEMRADHEGIYKPKGTR